MKTAEELRLEFGDDELTALANVEVNLRAGNYVHIQDPAYMEGMEDKSKKQFFNLNHSCDARGCRTAACIGGWVWLQMHMTRILEENNGKFKVSSFEESKAVSYVGRADYPLNKLYFPNCLHTKRSWEEITPEQAADAIRNFRETGKPEWGKVLDDPDITVREEEDHIEAMTWYELNE